MNLQDRIRLVKEARIKLKNHCICRKIIETEECFFVYTPSGFLFDSPFEGLKANHKILGKAVALERLERGCEYLWQSGGLRPPAVEKPEDVEFLRRLL